MANKIGVAGKCSAEYDSFLGSLEKILETKKGKIPVASCARIQVFKDGVTFHSKYTKGNRVTTVLRDDGVVQHLYTKKRGHQSIEF